MAASSQPLRSAEELASFFLQNPVLPDVPHTIAAMGHRQRLVQSWGVKPGSKVLEIGCGQGDMTIALADVVGPTGRVIGVDPGAADYGTPPLGEAHKHVLASPVGSQIEFVRANPTDYLAAFTEPEPFDYIVFSYCIPYFRDPADLPNMLTLMRKHTRGARLLIAENAMVTSRIEAVPHVLVVLALSAIESFLDGSNFRNFHVVHSPSQITAAAKASGWALEKEETVVPDPKLQDAVREVRMAISPKMRYESDIESLQVDAKTKTMLYFVHDTLKESVKRLEPQGGLEAVQNMDTWAASFMIDEGSVAEKV